MIPIEWTWFGLLFHVLCWCMYLVYSAPTFITLSYNLLIPFFWARLYLQLGIAYIKVYLALFAVQLHDLLAHIPIDLDFLRVYG